MNYGGVPNFGTPSLCTALHLMGNIKFSVWESRFLPINLYF